MSSLYNIHSEKIDIEERKVLPIYLLNHIDMPLNIDKNNTHKKHTKKPHAPYDIKDHFKEIAHLTERVNSELVKSKSKYRFCIYKNKNEIAIDVVILENQGKTKKIYQKNITHDEFTHWVENICDGEGFIFDSKI